MRTSFLIVAAITALLLPALASAQDAVRPLDRIYGPRTPGEPLPPGHVSTSAARRGAVGPAPMTQRSRSGVTTEPPLNRVYGPAGGSNRGASVGGGTGVGQPKGRTGLGTAGGMRSGSTATSKPAGPTYRGGSVGTRPRFGRSPSLSAPRR